MFRIIDKIILILTIVAAVSLTVAYLSCYIDPNIFVFPSLLGLAYHYLLIGNVLLLLYWIVRWKKIAWLEVVVILIGLPTFHSYYGIANEQTQDNGSDLTLLSYNVRYFDIYGWSQQKNTKSRMLDFLKNFKGDLICLQEFSLPDHPAEEQEITHQLKTFPYRYIHRGMAIFSRIPLLHCTPLPLDDKSSATCIFCDIVLHQDTIRLYNIHLESFRFGKAERAFIQEISQGKKSVNFSGGVKNIGQRLTTANKKRARQAGKIKNHLNHSPHPVIVCGDFNDTPLSYTYRKIKNGLEDSFIQKGRGLGNTYIGEFPSFRIDYILHSANLKTTNYNRWDVRFSDHYPVVVSLKKPTTGK